MIESEERISLLESQIDTMTDLARQTSKRAGIYEKGLREVMKHLEMILGEQSYMSSTYNIAARSLRNAGEVGRNDNMGMGGDGI